MRRIGITQFQCNRGEGPARADFVAGLGKPHPVRQLLERNVARGEPALKRAPREATPGGDLIDP